MCGGGNTCYISLCSSQDALVFSLISVLVSARVQKSWWCKNAPRPRHVGKISEKENEAAGAREKMGGSKGGQAILFYAGCTWRHYFFFFTFFFTLFFSGSFFPPWLTCFSSRQALS